MAILLGDAGLIVGEARFRDRVEGAMLTAASAVYGQTYLVPTSAATAAGSKVLTFTAVPAWVVVGGGVTDITTSGVIPAGATIVALTTTTVTLSVAITGTGVVSGDIINFIQYAARSQFATRVANGNFSLREACFIVLANTTVANEAVLATQPDNAIPDADIQNAINGNWNLLAGA